MAVQSASADSPTVRTAGVTECASVPFKKRVLCVRPAGNNGRTQEYDSSATNIARCRFHVVSYAFRAITDNTCV